MLKEIQRVLPIRKGFRKMDRWVGKVAIVTGASGEIGAAIATKLVEEGLQVVGLARRAERVKALSRELSDKKGKLHAIRVDVTRESNVLDAFKWVTENLGPVYILINCAGIVQDATLIEGFTERWRRVFETNVIGLCVATREAVNVMKSHNIDGHIVHINSILGHVSSCLPSLNVFPASKYAVTSLTETLRQEFNRCRLKIKISCVSPGVVFKEVENAIKNKRVNTEIGEILKSAPSLKPEDVANAVLYVLSTPPHVQVQDVIIRPIGEVL